MNIIKSKKNIAAFFFSEEKDQNEHKLNQTGVLEAGACCRAVRPVWTIPAQGAKNDPDAP